MTEVVKIFRLRNWLFSLMCNIKAVSGQESR